MKAIGCDIIEIDRIDKAIKKHGKIFLDKLFTSKEQSYCFTYKFPSAHFAVRFAGKEAVAKALGTGFGHNLSFLDVEILNRESGAPQVILSNKARELFSNPNIMITLSHSKNSALAFAVII